ncbi:YutD-like domain-containing protein [Paenibacillus sp. YN15]|uniref:YutD-like domain-containing protein n=1 Tax=Paenibacillus sp. YN15 TaxID=1742774 RepID=UPI000DCE3361|nr:YutD-like domain-containing protein [Paenibacillus sp. YN15]RAV06297.1 DUF1027 domain-containing protein [Paenibacillus sp. YN15]
MYHIGGNTYSLVLDHKNGWNYEVFRDRYSEVLDRYDFIVGDWGYNQLRLRGFFKEPNNKGSKDSSIALLHDYLNEYCNFGCAYFIIEKLASRKNAEGREDGDDSEGNGLYEAERSREYELKPRHQYQRKQQETAEPRQRNGQERFTAAVHTLTDNGRKPAQQEGGKRDGDREPRGGQKGQDNRRGQEGSRNGRDHGGGKPRGEADGGRQREFGGGKPRERENGGREGEAGRKREQDGRRREQQDSRHREQQNRPNRDQQPGERKQQGQPQGEKGKHHPPRNNNKSGGNGGEHQRNRDKDREKRNDRERERDREKGRAEPLV